MWSTKGCWHSHHFIFINTQINVFLFLQVVIPYGLTGRYQLLQTNILSPSSDEDVEPSVHMALQPRTNNIDIFATLRTSNAHSTQLRYDTKLHFVVLGCEATQTLPHHWHLPMSVDGVTTKNIMIFSTMRTSTLRHKVTSKCIWGFYSIGV